MGSSYQIYTAESQVLDRRRLLFSIVRGFIDSRYMAYRLFIKDIRAEYARSVLGVFWDFVDPLVLAGIFYFLMRQGIINVGSLNMPRPIFVIYGILLYQTFLESTLLSVSLIKSSKGLISQLKIPPEALILSCVYRVFFFAFFRILIMLGFSLALMSSAREQGLDAFSPIGFLMFLALFPIIVLPGLAMGVLLAPFNVIYGDVQRAVQLVIIPLRYASPVMWPIPWAWLNTWNPIALILTDLRLLATTGTLENVSGLVLRCGIFGIILAMALIVFHLSVPILTDRV